MTKPAGPFASTFATIVVSSCEATASSNAATKSSIVRTEWSQAVRQFLERYDYVVSPTAQAFPFDAEETWPREIGGHRMTTYHEWMKGVCLITMSGCPSLAVPAGLGPKGLPIGLQIIAPVHDEMACLQLAAAYEAADPWWLKRLPPLLKS